MKVSALLFLLFICFYSLGQGKEISLSTFDQKTQSDLEKSEVFLKQNVDSAYFYGARSEARLAEIESEPLKCRVVCNMGDIFKAKGDFPLALKYYLKAKNIIEEELSLYPNRADLVLEKAEVLLSLGSLHLLLRNHKKSLFYFEAALKKLEKVNSSALKNEIATCKLKVYNNIAAVLMQQKEFESALVYLQNAMHANKIVSNSTIESTLLNNIGICYLESKKYELANDNFQKSLLIRITDQDKQGQAQVLNNIGKNEVYKGNFELANTYFLKALLLSREIGSKESAIISLESLSLVNDTLGKYKEALKYHRQFKSLNDSLFNLESKTTIASLEEKYEREKETKRIESDKLKSQIRTIVLVSVLVLLLAIAIFFSVVMRNRAVNSRLKQEKLELERETLQKNLAFKERELTANALFSLKNNELISRISDSLLKAKSSFTKDNQQLIQDIVNELRTSQNNHMWEEFEFHFTKVHATFYESLQEKFPNLTSNEKRLCAFLKLNMSTKDISAITQQSVNSITVARSRLRKKLNIEGEDVHLINFLMKF